MVPGLGGGEALVHFHVHGGGGPPEQGAGALGRTGGVPPELARASGAAAAAIVGLRRLG